jgi:hypothetical protein
MARLTNRERLIASACLAQEMAADAHYWACVALAASQWETACAWQAVHARAHERAAGAVIRLTKASKAWLRREA